MTTLRQTIQLDTYPYIKCRSFGSSGSALVHWLLPSEWRRTRDRLTSLICSTIVAYNVSKLVENRPRKWCKVMCVCVCYLQKKITFCLYNFDTLCAERLHKTFDEDDTRECLCVCVRERKKKWQGKTAWNEMMILSLNSELLYRTFFSSYGISHFSFDTTPNNEFREKKIGLNHLHDINAHIIATHSVRISTSCH